MSDLPAVPERSSPGPVRRVRKKGQSTDTVSPRHASIVRQAMIEAAGYTVEDLQRARQAKLDALDATDPAGSADHTTRLRAAGAIDEVVLPRVHGNAGGPSSVKLEMDFSPWLRNLLERKRSSD